MKPEDKVWEVQLVRTERLTSIVRVQAPNRAEAKEKAQALLNAGVSDWHRGEGKEFVGSVLQDEVGEGHD